ncbi:hypothetical protein ABIB90_008256 [Bradyrhizobium sp. JR4.1]|uniref:hypothetical protein n=1 Tax=unclassified Bradyrhizobium TaxID=2631580 RepID=UPI003395E29A
MNQFFAVMLNGDGRFSDRLLGVAAWRISEEKGADVTGQVPHHSYNELPPTN